MSTHSVSRDVAITTSLATTPAIPFGCSYLQLQVPNGETVTSITFYGSTEEDGDYDQIVIDAAVYTLTVAADNYYCLKPEVYGVPFLKLVGDAAADLKLAIVSQ